LTAFRGLPIVEPMLSHQTQLPFLSSTLLASGLLLRPART
jgi:hypothetical protein